MASMITIMWRFIFCLVGLLLSIYALHVELSKEHDKEYKAMCDISEHMSCTKVFSSRWGTGFGIVEPILGKDSLFNVPNSIFGIIFYTSMALLGFFSGKVAAVLMVFMSVKSCLGSIYLAYILFFVLHDTCVVCIATYVVNLSLFLINFFHLKTFSKPKLKSN